MALLPWILVGAHVDRWRHAQRQSSQGLTPYMILRVYTIGVIDRGTGLRAPQAQKALEPCWE